MKAATGKDFQEENSELRQLQVNLLYQIEAPAGKHTFYTKWKQPQVKIYRKKIVNGSSCRILLNYMNRIRTWTKPLRIAYYDKSADFFKVKKLPILHELV
ncbi:hypothetical protein Tco_0755204 [Tanacetum coccineum]